MVEMGESKSVLARDSARLDAECAGHVPSEGIAWPGDPGDKARKHPTAAVLHRVEGYLATLDPVPAVSVGEVVEGAGVTHPTAVSALTHLGWFKETPNQRAKWMPPLDDPHAPAEDDFELEEEPGDDGALTETGAEGTEFTWPVDLDSIDHTATVGQVLAIYRAAGMAIEIRVRRGSPVGSIRGARQQWVLEACTSIERGTRLSAPLSILKEPLSPVPPQAVTARVRG